MILGTRDGSLQTGKAVHDAAVNCGMFLGEAIKFNSQVSLIGGSRLPGGSTKFSPLTDDPPNSVRATVRFRIHFASFDLFSLLFHQISVFLHQPTVLYHSWRHSNGLCLRHPPRTICLQQWHPPHHPLHRRVLICLPSKHLAQIKLCTEKNALNALTIR